MSNISAAIPKPPSGKNHLWEFLFLDLLTNYNQDKIFLASNEQTDYFPTAFHIFLSI